MEDLLKPDYGVMILTICNFLLLVYLLKRFAWDGLIGALERREQQIADDKRQAQQARTDAEELKKQLDDRLAGLSQEAAKKMAEAVQLGVSQRDQLLADAKEQADRFLAQAKAQIEAEKNQALADVRNEVVQTAMLAAEKIIRQQIDDNTAQQAVERVLTEIKKK